MKQGKINTLYKCEYCNKVLSTSLRLSTHVNVCIIRLKNDENSNNKKNKDNIEKIIRKKDKEIIRINKEKDE